MSPRIHPTALIDPAAELADGVEVGPYCIVGPDVIIGEGTRLLSHVVLKGPMRMGRNNQVFQFSTLGEMCQDKKYKGEPTRLEIGDDNVFREACTVHRGTVQDEGLTRIGDRNLLMVNTHVAHDCRIGSDNILANNVGLAGHVRIGNGAVLGGMVGVHQFVSIGSFAMAAGGAILFKDVPAYVMVGGNPAVARGMNFEGMRRRGMSAEAIGALRKAYKLVYRSALPLEQIMPELEQLGASLPEVALFCQSVQSSHRGLAR